MKGDDTKVMVDAIIKQTERLGDEASRHKQTLAMLQAKTDAMAELANENIKLNGQVTIWSEKAARLAEKVAVLERQIKDAKGGLPKLKELYDAAQQLAAATKNVKGAASFTAMNRRVLAALDGAFGYCDQHPF